jgi:cytochrome c peroxidase
VRIASAALLLLAACSADPGTPDPGALPLPASFPAPFIPADNPYTAEKAELGRHLFYDERLSGNGEQSCAGCHQQDMAFTDGLPVAIGSTGEAGALNSPSLANVAYAMPLGWAHPELTALEDQLLGPMLGTTPVELGMSGREDEIMARLAADPATADRFAAAYPDAADPITFERTRDAIATFVRTLMSGDSDFDRFRAGDFDALSPAARRGSELFRSTRLGCGRCHSGFNLTLAVAFQGGAASPDEAMHDTGLGTFRVPSLRNVALTAPYMHDGSLATLDDVIAFYEFPPDNPDRSDLLKDFTLTDAERTDLRAFLDSLTDHAFISDPRFADPAE